MRSFRLFKVRANVLNTLQLNVDHEHFNRAKMCSLHFQFHRPLLSSLDRSLLASHSCRVCVARECQGDARVQRVARVVVCRSSSSVPCAAVVVDECIDLSSNSTNLVFCGPLFVLLID